MQTGAESVAGEFCIFDPPTRIFEEEKRKRPMSRKSRRRNSLTRRVQNQNRRSPFQKMRLKDLEAVLAESKNCYYCGRWCQNHYHVDHKIPLSRGGTHARSNLCRSCPQCNLEKAAMTDQEFRQSTPFWIRCEERRSHVRRSKKTHSPAETMKARAIHAELDRQFRERLSRED